MKAVFSSIKHDPDNGDWGDCHRACVASLLELPIEEVPHCWDGYDGSSSEMEIGRRNDWMTEFLLSKGFILHSFYADGGEISLDEMIDMFSDSNPGVYFLLSGESATGNDHAVICRNGVIEHNPTPGSDLVGPMSHWGYWLIETLGSSVGYKAE